MKYRKSFFIQVNRQIFKDETFKQLSYKSKWAYICLVEAEHRYTSGRHGYCETFYHSDADMAYLCDMPIATYKRCKSELKENGIIETRKTPILTKRGKETGQFITLYKLLD